MVMPPAGLQPQTGVVLPGYTEGGDGPTQDLPRAAVRHPEPPRQPREGGQWGRAEKGKL